MKKMKAKNGFKNDRAILIYANGKKETILPSEKGKFSLMEITEILESLLIEPIFMGSMWLFKSKDLLEMRYNDDVSKSLGMPIYGDVLLVPENLLEPYFFFPYEAMAESMERNMMRDEDDMDDIEEKIARKINKEESKEEINKKLLEESMSKGYGLLFEKNKTYDQILKNFILFVDDLGKEYTIGEDKNDRLKAISKMMEFFISTEEYEKCSNLKELYDYIEEMN